tara:strand:+ start:7076 stop:7888 length:813 start_codon:yes stop_codon:yes gene_type:complete
MSNIVAMALCRIQDNNSLEYNKDKGADKTFKLYSSMCDILCESADRFVQGDWDFEIIENDVKNYQEIFDKNFGEVYEMWDEGKNNILFLDLDTFIVNEVDVFDKHENFQMFNYTDPKTLGGKDASNKYGLQHEHYLNAGVRYYPKTMSQDVWDLGWKYAKDWDYDIWGTEQIIFNEMMYSQDKDHTRWLTPEMNYQMMNATPDLLENPNYIQQLNLWNETELNKSKIVHLHGTRGAEQTLLTQWALWKKLTGEEFEFEHVNIVDGKVEYK